MFLTFLVRKVRKVLSFLTLSSSPFSPLSLPYPVPTNDIEIIIEGCNLGACTSPSSSSSSSSSPSSFSPSLFVPFCGEGKGGLVGEVAEEVERKLEEGRLYEALGVLVAVGGVQDCTDVEVFFFFFFFFVLFCLFNIWI